MAQLDGPVGIDRAEAGDGTDPCGAVAEQGDRGDVPVGTRGKGVLKPKPVNGTASTTSATAAPSEYPPITNRVSGQLFIMYWMWPLMSLAPMSTSVSAGYLTA